MTSSSQETRPLSTKPGMPALLALLHGEPLPADLDAPTLLTLAEAESILPWVAHLAPSLPGAAEALRQSQINAFLYTAELTGLLRAFAAASLPVLLLKGPSFAERIYGAAHLRPCRDLDLLVRPEHFGPTQSLLLSLGFHPNSLPDDYHQSLTRNTTTVELHHNLDNPLTFDFDLPSAWQAAVPTVFHGQPARLFAPPDELLYVCLHGTRHRFNRLSYLLDIALALHHSTPQPTIRPQANHLCNLFDLGTRLAHSLDPALPPPTPDAHTETLAAELWQSLMTTPATDPDWQTLHRFYLRLEPTFPRRLSRRIRQARILATRITEPDRTFAAGFGLPYTWAAYLLRPIRLLRK